MQVVKKPTEGGGVWADGTVYAVAAIIFMLCTACKACSTPGYEIFGMGGISKLGGSPMQPRLQSPTAYTVPSAHTPPPSVGFFTTCMYLLKWIQPPPPGPLSL